MALLSSPNRLNRSRPTDLAVGGEQLDRFIDVDEPAQLAAAREPAADVVEPEALSEFDKVIQGAGHSLVLI